MIWSFSVYGELTYLCCCNCPKTRRGPVSKIRLVERTTRRKHRLLAVVRRRSIVTLVERGADGATRRQFQNLINPEAVAEPNEADVIKMYASLQQQVMRFPADKGHLHVANGVFYSPDYAETVRL